MVASHFDAVGSKYRDGAPPTLGAVSHPSNDIGARDQLLSANAGPRIWRRGWNKTDQVILLNISPSKAYDSTDRESRLWASAFVGESMVGMER